MSPDSADEAKSEENREEASQGVREGGGNGKNHDMENNRSPLKRSAIRALVQDFTPLWFTWCMNSGILSILTRQNPHQFTGLHVISTIFFLIDLTLFVLFTTTFLARLLIFRKAAYYEIINDLQLLTLLACWPIAYLTIPPNIASIVTTTFWGGHGWTIFSYVLWWIGAAWTVLTLLFVVLTLIRHHEAHDQQLPFTVIIPAVGVATLAAEGASVTLHAAGLEPRLAIPVIIFSFFCVGIGLFLAIFLYTFLLHQLLTRSWPAPEQTAVLFVFVGPMGQCATALQSLGSSAQMHFGPYNHGTFLTAQAAAALYPACMLLALLFSGVGFIFLAIAVYAMLERAAERTLTWAPTWNAIIFPTGVLTTSLLAFAIEMDSNAWRVVTTVFVIALVIVYLVNIVGTALGIYKGQLLIVREDWRVKKRLEEDEKLK